MPNHWPDFLVFYSIYMDSGRNVMMILFMFFSFTATYVNVHLMLFRTKLLHNHV